MGRLIDADKLIEYWLTPPNNIGWADEIECVNNQPTVEAIPKADYEARLKSDMVAMLTELQLKIEEMSGLVTEIHGEEWNEVNVINSQDVLSFIQQKINSLKE